MAHLRGAVGRMVVGCLILPLVLTVGCGDEEKAKAIGTFRQASGRLATTFQIYVANANTVEEENYINRLVQTPGLFDKKVMEGKDLYTPDEIALRGAAVRALGDYLAVMASLEAGGSSDQIEADAKTAGKSLARVTSDVSEAIAKHTGRAPVDIAGPVSTAFAVVGTVLKLIEAHKGRAVVKKSILDNDAAIQALFAMIEDETGKLYERQTKTLSEKQTVLVGAFDDEAKRAGQGSSPGLVELGERLKAVQREMALQAGANPAPAIAAFQKAHDDLIALMKGGGSQKASLSSLIASAKIFEAEVEPLVVNVRAFVTSF